MNFNIVAAIWCIIIGGLIIFIDGRGWCIACNGNIFTALGVISILIGVIAIVAGRGRAANVANG
ncbi:MAG: hypothetical protein WA584_15980 [Pyrinomonadaceae bacterium]